MNDIAGQQTLPLSHTADPQTSYDAADKMIKSGRLSKQEMGVYRAILRHCCDSSVDRTFTAKELACWSTILGSIGISP